VVEGYVGNREIGCNRAQGAHSMPKTTSAPSFGRRYRGMVNVVFWITISTKGKCLSF